MWEHFNETERKFIVGWLLFSCPENFNQTVKDLAETDFPNNPKMLWTTIIMVNKRKDMLLFYDKFNSIFLENLFKANSIYQDYLNDDRNITDNGSFAPFQEVEKIKAMLENGSWTEDSV